METCHFHVCVNIIIKSLVEAEISHIVERFMIGLQDASNIILGTNNEKSCQNIETKVVEKNNLGPDVHVKLCHLFEQKNTNFSLLIMETFMNMLLCRSGTC